MRSEEASSRWRRLEWVSFAGRIVVPVSVAVYWACIRKKHLMFKYLIAVGALAVKLAHAISAFLSFVASHLATPTVSIKALSSATAFGPLRERLLLCRTESASEPERCVECTVLHDPGEQNTDADVIFIHGLHGSLYNTWRQGQWGEGERKGRVFKLCPRPRSVGAQPMDPSATFVNTFWEDSISHYVREENNNERPKIESEEEKSGYSQCWPRDWLPKDCPRTRIIAINYSTDPFLWRPIWIPKKNRTTIEERSEEMMAHLKRLGVGSRPIVWVGHSKGGLFVKQMLVSARDSGEQSFSGFYRFTKGIMFYSVPHRGSFLASLNLPFLKQSVELTEVMKDSPRVLSLHQRFLKLFEEDLSETQVLSFTETDRTLMSVFFMRIVSVASADPNVGDFYGVSLDHREICKPRSRKCFLYRELANLINSVL